MMSAKCLRPLPLILALQAAFGASAYAQFVVADGAVDTVAKTLAGAASGEVKAGGSLLVSGSAAGVAMSGTTSLINAGTIRQGGSGRTIDVNPANSNVVITNQMGGTITGAGAQVIRVDKASSKFIIDNQGTIAHIGTITAGGERAIKVDADYATSGNQIINGAINNRSAIISATGNDAIRIGSNVTLVNYGSIFSTGDVNTSCPKYMVAEGNPCTSDLSAADGVAIENGRKNAVILNYGTITGPRHGIDGGDPVNATADANLLNLMGVGELKITHAADNSIVVEHVVGNVSTPITIANPIIVNYAGGIITGNNGSGVGLDGHGVVINYGTISGNYAGAGNVYDHENAGVTTSNGDGDGVDIDGVAYIDNHGRIEGTGAGGRDSGGQPNGADGIAAGGGTIINRAGATIYGQSKGILIDDGSDGLSAPTGRGTYDPEGNNGAGDILTVASTVHIRNAGIIIGETKSAIGMVGNYNDELLNDVTGVIIGGAQATRLGENNSTVAGAAIQIGDGDDLLTNYGHIEGKNGLAIDMGNGNDTLRLFGGSVIGTIDGGSGTNLLETNGTQVFEAGKVTNFQNFAIKGGTTTFNYALGNVNNVQIDDGGTLRVNGGFDTSQDLTVNGTLLAPTGSAFRTINVAGDYSQSASGILEARIGANGASDQLVVAGMADVADGATIRAVATTYVKDGTRYTLIDAGTLNAAPANLHVSINGNSNFVTYTLQRDGNDLVLIAHREQSLGQILPVRDQNITTGLENILSTGSASSQALLTAIENLSSTQAVSRAARQLLPETNGSQLQAAKAAQGSLFSAFDNRSDAARNGDRAAFDGQTGMSSGDGNRGRVWMQGLAAFAKQKTRNGANGYDVDAQGLAVGYEMDLDGRDLVGVSGGYTQAGTDGRDAGVGNDNNVKSFHLGAYFSRTEASYKLDASVAVSANRYNAQRAVNIGGFSETLRGKFDGTQLGARFEYGLPFQIDSKWAGRWIMGARLARLDNGAYTETGGVSAQNIGSTHSSSAQSVFGAELRNRIDHTSSATLHARWLHEFADTPAVTASYVAGGPSFQVDGVQPGRNGLLLGTSYRKTTASGTLISVGYDLESRARYLGHQLTARAMWSF
ncbi:MAG: autotransporter domain-containing protein [Oxalicibacterium faecigallinarum]|uniref:autotransporter outer membrane beta-barrel domain-containing protein n=1 Tax=Oxalicibacterium faecigallinarum TaxID=573741 RepID=UPI002806DB10|nr:autotransporter domain-containing protein [Oxalicibacterium faecigallinarum]MDQ7969856.1 autotransporter domain-containing protein [Oxalicibacterium faecigallinarum]